MTALIGLGAILGALAALQVVGVVVHRVTMGFWPEDGEDLGTSLAMGVVVVALALLAYLACYVVGLMVTGGTL